MAESGPPHQTCSVSYIMCFSMAEGGPPHQTCSVSFIMCSSIAEGGPPHQTCSVSYIMCFSMAEGGPSHHTCDNDDQTETMDSGVFSLLLQSLDSGKIYTVDRVFM